MRKALDADARRGQAHRRGRAEYKRVFQTGSQQRSNVFGPFREAADLIRSARLGKIHTVTVGVGGPSKWCDLPAEETELGLDWDLWLGPAPLRPYNSILSPRGIHDFFPRWRNYREYAGGGHADMGAHHYDIAQRCLGMDDSSPVAITILGNLAYWNGRHLRWDPAKWEFVDDAEANRWLDRQRRGPWQLPAI